MQAVRTVAVSGYTLLATSNVLATIVTLLSIIGIREVASGTSSPILSTLTSELEYVGVSISSSAWFFIGMKARRKFLIYMGVANLLSLGLQWFMKLYYVLVLPYLYGQSYATANTFDANYTQFLYVANPVLFLFIPAGLWIAAGIFHERLFKAASVIASVDFTYQYVLSSGLLLPNFGPQLTLIFNPLLVSAYSIVTTIAFCRVSDRQSSFLSLDAIHESKNGS
jgi:hypothetical protein